MNKKKNPAAVALGKMKSEAKALAVRENGKKGGRPKGVPFLDKAGKDYMNARNL